MKITEFPAKLEWSVLCLFMVFLTSCMLPDSSAPKAIAHASGENRFLGVFKNQSTPPGASLNDVLQIDYPLTSDTPTHIELRRSESGIEAVSYVGAHRRNYQILIAGNGYKYSAGKLDFGVSSYGHENKFFFTNIDQKISTRKIASLDAIGNLVFTLNTVETGMNWFVPTIGGSSQCFVFEKLR